MLQYKKRADVLKTICLPCKKYWKIFETINKLIPLNIFTY